MGAFPGSLSEGAGGAGVRTIQCAARKPGGCGRFSSPLRNSKVFTFCHSSGDTPSVTPVGRDSSLREGAGDGCVPFNVPLGNRNVAGDFHRPYETQKCLHSAIQRTTLPQSRPLGVPAPSEREPGWGAYHSTCRPEAATLRAIFIAPTKTQSVLHFTIQLPMVFDAEVIPGRALTYGNQLKA